MGPWGWIDWSSGTRVCLQLLCQDFWSLVFEKDHLTAWGSLSKVDTSWHVTGPWDRLEETPDWWDISQSQRGAIHHLLSATWATMELNPDLTFPRIAESSTTGDQGNGTAGETFRAPELAATLSLWADIAVTVCRGDAERAALEHNAKTDAKAKGWFVIYDWTCKFPLSRVGTLPSYDCTEDWDLSVSKSQVNLLGSLLTY